MNHKAEFYITLGKGREIEKSNSQLKQAKKLYKIYLND